MRARAVLVAMIALAAVPSVASAADHPVRTTDAFTFSPSKVTVDRGDSVTFSNPSRGFHQVRWVKGAFDSGAKAWPPEPMVNWPSDQRRTFTGFGRFVFYCTVHGSPDGSGMAGTVTVRGTDLTAPKVSKLKATYRKHVPRAAFRLSERAKVVAVLTRVRRGPDATVATRTKTLDAGARTISFGRRALVKGRYTVALRARDTAGNRSKRATRTLTVG